MRDFATKLDIADATQILSLMNAREGYRFLTTRDNQGYYAKRIADALDIENRGLGISATAKLVFDKLNDSGGMPEPAPPASDPRIAPKPCDGCGGIGDTAKFLRWAKVARGEPVTVSLDEALKPATLHWLTPEIIMAEWFKPWEVDTAIRFKLLTTGKADMRFKFAPIDGPGGTRGMAWLPDQSVEHMESGGDLSGDGIIDSTDRWVTKEEVHETGEHEVGHAIGLPHTNSRLDVMYAYASGKRRVHSVNDKRAKTLRYPPLQAVAA